jgi:hypothetical protein
VRINVNGTPRNVGWDKAVGIVTHWAVRGLNPDGGEIFLTRPDWPWGPLSLLFNGYRVIPGGKAAEALL